MDQIEEVRSKTDIIELIGDYVSLKKSGRSFQALCPFHSETKPSFFVSPELQIFKCFGCGKSGNVFSFLMETEGMSFGEALRFLAQKAGVKLKPYQPTGEEKERQSLYEINHLASEFYHYLLTKHSAGKKALDYVQKKRKIIPQSIAKFKLGYAPNMWDGLIDFLAKKKGYRIEDLEKAGLVIKGKENYYDRFRDRLVFPLFDHRGNVCGFSGRVVDDDKKLSGARQEAPKYLNTPETPIYHKSDLLYGLETTRSEIKKKNLAILVEGEIDVIASYQVGVANIAAIKGSALTQGQVNLLARFCENIALSFDFDVAGDMAARRGIEIAERTGLNIRVIRPLFGKDPDECIQKSAKLWHQSVAKTIPIWDFYIESAFERHGGQTAEEKKKIGEELMPLFSSITNEIVKAHYVKILAKRLGVDEMVIGREMVKAKRRSEIGQSKKEMPADDQPSRELKPRRQILEEYLLALILQSGKPIKIKTRITTAAVQKILKNLSKTPKKKLSIKNFYQELPEELKETVSRLYLQELGESDFKNEIAKVLKELERLDLRDKLAELAAHGDLDEFNQLYKKLKELE